MNPNSTVTDRSSLHTPSVTQPLSPQRRRAVTGNKAAIPTTQIPLPPPPSHMKKRSLSHIKASPVQPPIAQRLLVENLLNLEDPLIENLLAKLDKTPRRDFDQEKFLEGRSETTVTLLRASASGDTDDLDAFADDEYLIDTCRDARGKTALHIAAINNQVKVIETLLSGNFDPNITDGHKGSWCRTPLHDAVLNDSFEAAEALLKCGTYKMDVKDSKGFAPLHYAASEGRTRFIPLLVMYGANIHLSSELPDSDSPGETPLALTIRHLHSDTMLALLAQARDAAEKQILFGKSLAEILYDVASREVLQTLLNEDEPLLIDTMICPQSQTIKSEYVLSIKALAFFRAILRCMNESSFDYSTELAHFTTIAAKKRKPFVLETFYRLAESQIDPNTTDSKRNTPLHNAAAKGDAQSVAILLKRGAKIEAENEKRDLALHLAAKNGYRDIIEKLKERDTNKKTLSSVNEKKETPFFVAAKKTKHLVLQSLYQDGLVDKKNELGDTALLSVLQTIDSLDTDNYDGEELEVLLENAEETISFLLEKGANVHRRGSFDKTAVQLVSQNKIFTKCEIKACVLAAAKTQKPIAEESDEEDDASKMKALEEDLRNMLLEQEQLNNQQQSKNQGTPPEASVSIKPLARQNSFESMHIREASMADLLQDLQLEPKQNSTEPDHLKHFVSLLKQVENLADIKDLLNELAVEGKNVLHFIAEHHDFSLFEQVIKKHYNSPLFTKLITQETTADGETPLHTICRCHNVDLLRCLLTSSNPDIREYLKFAASAKTTYTKRNAVLYLGLPFEDTTLTGENLLNRQARCVETLLALIKLFGKDETAKLAAEHDSEGHNLLAISKSSGNFALATAISELHNAMWKK